jgi:hypothetical protein
MFLVCICSLTYPACNAHTPYYHPWLAWLYTVFPHYLTSGTIFVKKVIEHKMCILSLSTILSEPFLILRRLERDMIKNYIGLRVNCRLFLSDFKVTWICFDRFSKNSQISNFMKIRPVGTELFHADWRTDGQTDMKLTVAFRKFAKAPNIITVRYILLIGEWLETTNIKGRVTLSHYHIVT